MNVAIPELFYRPMTKENQDILLSGQVQVNSGADAVAEHVLEAEGQHLSCYIAGMVAVGSKIFPERKADLKTAEKLLNGCLWAYSNTATGIMPEVFHAVKCPDSQC